MIVTGAAEELLNADRKEFTEEGFTVSISQVEERGLHGFAARRLDLEAALRHLVATQTYENHHICFQAGLILIENLTGLEPLIGRPFLFSCLPLKLEQAYGSPVRAVAMI